MQADCPSIRESSFSLCVSIVSSFSFFFFFFLSFCISPFAHSSPCDIQVIISSRKDKNKKGVKRKTLKITKKKKGKKKKGGAHSCIFVCAQSEEIGCTEKPLGSQRGGEKKKKACLYYFSGALSVFFFLFF